MTQVSRSAWNTNLVSLIPDNTSGEVGPEDIRNVLVDLEDSVTWYDEANIVNDTTPQLGGNLDVNGNSIVSTSNANITLAPDGTGDVVLGTITIDADQTVGASQDGYALVYDHTAGKLILTAQSGGTGGGATELADLTDVGSTTATNRNVLVADGNSWESRALTEADISDLGTYLTDITGQVLGSLSDVTLTSAAQGDVLYRNATGWVNLGAGTSGQFLQTQGVGANPQWATPAGSGNVSNTGTPVDNQIAIWTASTTVEGTSGLTYNGSALAVTGNIAVTGVVDGRDLAVDGAKLDGIESGADVTDSANVQSALESVVLATVTPAETDGFFIFDSSANGLAFVAYSSLFNSLVEDTTPQLGGNLDLNSNAIVFPGATVTDVTGSDTLIVSGTAGASGDLAIWNIDGDLVDGPTPPSGAIVGTTDVQSLTNKTINANNNTISNLHIGNSLEVSWNAINDVTDRTAFASGDKLLIFEAGVGMRKIDFDDLPSGAGGGDAWSDAVNSDIVPTGNNDVYDLGSSTAAFATGHINDLYSQSILLAERADHVNTPIAGSGELWVRNDTTQNLIFTDDTGSDNVVLTSGSGDVIASATSVGADAIFFGDASDSNNWKQTTITNFISDNSIQLEPSEGGFVNGDKTKLDSIESGADVTDAANVETAIEAIVLEAVSGATGDEVLVIDATDGGLKAVLWQNLPGTGGGISNVVEDTTPQLGGALDGQGNRITGYLNNTPGTVSGTLTAATHGGGIHVTSGSVTIPTTAGFSCVLIAGGAHTVTFNGATSAAMAAGDVMTIMVEDATTIHAVLTEAANKVSFT